VVHPAGEMVLVVHPAGEMVLVVHPAGEMVLMVHPAGEMVLVDHPLVGASSDQVIDRSLLRWLRLVRKWFFVVSMTLPQISLLFAFF
jgi:hypothetical protein